MVEKTDYMQLATRVYAASDRNRVDVPDGWEELDWKPDNFVGFSAGIYRNTKTNESILKNPNFLMW